MYSKNYVKSLKSKRVKLEYWILKVLCFFVVVVGFILNLLQQCFIIQDFKNSFIDEVIHEMCLSSVPFQR